MREAVLSPRIEGTRASLVDLYIMNLPKTPFSRKIDWKNALVDVKPFLVRTDEAKLLTPENFGQLLNSSLV